MDRADLSLDQQSYSKTLFEYGPSSVGENLVLGKLAHFEL